MALFLFGESKISVSLCKHVSFGRGKGNITMSAVYIHRLAVTFECPNGERFMSRVYKQVLIIFHVSLVAESLEVHVSCV